MSDLLLVPLEDTVVFPGMPVTLTVDAGDEARVLLVPRHEQEYAKVGIVAEVSERVRLPGGAGRLAVRPPPRRARRRADRSQGRLRVEVDERPDEAPPPVQTRELEREYRAVVEEILELRGDDGRISAFVRSITDAGSAGRYRPATRRTSTSTRRSSCSKRSTSSSGWSWRLQFQQERLAELHVRKRIRDDVETGAQKQQREYFLRRQMDAIRKELGENEGSVVEEYRTKIAEAGMPDAVRQQAERELRASSGWATPPPRRR